MKKSDIAKRRLYNQKINSQTISAPDEIVKWLGAVQAQDYYGSLWAVGLRTVNAGEKSVENAIAEKRIIRTWCNRGTLHFVYSEDLHWMVELVACRIIARAAGRNKQLELSRDVLLKSYKILEKVLKKTKLLTRNELMNLLEHEGIATKNQRGYHIFWMAAYEGLICFGPMKGKQQTFTLLDNWIPSQKKLNREESLTELAARYFESRGPATLHDFASWSGLTITDARIGLESVKEKLSEEIINGQIYWMSNDSFPKDNNATNIYLLPGFDEYLLGYKDRGAILEHGDVKKITPWSNGMFQSTVVKDGKIVGTWKRTLMKNKVILKVDLFSPIKKNEKLMLENTVKQYGGYLNMPTELV